MPVEITPKNKVRVGNPLEAQVRDKTIWDNAKLGWTTGFEENTIKLFGDIALKQEAIRKGQAEIAKDEWNESHPLYNENIKWEPYLTYDLVFRANESMNIGAQRQDAFAKSSLAGKTAQVISSFGGMVFDPINLIPVPFLGTVGKASTKGIRALKRMGTIGATSGAIEAGLTPLTASAYEVRGQDYTARDVMTNVGMAFIAGGILSGVIDGSVASYKYLRGLRHPDAIDDKTMSAFYKQEQPWGFDVTPYLTRLRNVSELNTRKHQNNFYNDTGRIEPRSNQAIFVDSRGRYTYDAKDNNLLDDAISFTTEPNTLVMTGSRQEVNKHLNALQNNLIPAQNIKLRLSNSGEEIVISKNMFGDDDSLNNAIKKYLKKEIDYNASKEAGITQPIDQFKLGPDVVFEFKNKNTSAELEVTNRDGKQVERLIITEDGKKRVVTNQTEIQKIIEASARPELLEDLKLRNTTQNISTIKRTSTVDNVTDPRKTEIDAEASKMSSRSRNAKTDSDIEQVDNTQPTDQETFIKRIDQQYSAEGLKEFGLEIRNGRLVEIAPTIFQVGSMGKALKLNRDRVKNSFLLEQQVIDDKAAKQTVFRDAVNCDKPGL